MNIRHFGIYVKNIELVHDILMKLGFSITYYQNEIWDGKETNIRKYIYKGQKLELIQSDEAICNSYHISIDGKVVPFLRDYNVVKKEGFNKELILEFVYIGDSIYFEFVRKKNDS